MANSGGIIASVNGFLRRKDKDEAMVESMRRLQGILDEIFGKRVAEVAKIDAKRMQAAVGLKDENILLQSNPDFQQLSFIQDIYRKSFRNPILFLRNLRAQREDIGKFQGELAEFVLHELERIERQFGSWERTAILLQLWAIVDSQDSSKEKVIGFIKTPPHQQTIGAAINGVPKSGIANKVRMAISGLVNEELEWIINYHEEVKSWEGSAFITKDVEFFQIESNNIVYGMSAQHPGLMLALFDKYQGRATLLCQCPPR